MKTPTGVIVLANQNPKIDRLWFLISMAAWIAILPYAVRRQDWQLTGKNELVVLGSVFVVCVLKAGFLMLYFVGIPSRIALNLALKERRRNRLWETVTCVVAFVSMSLVFWATS